MSRTDKDIDRGLQQLAPLVPEASVWDELEKQLYPQRRFWHRFRRDALIPVGSGIAATLVLVAMVFFMRSGQEGVWPEGPDQASGEGASGLESPVQIATGQKIETNDVRAQGADNRPRGKFVRHLYAGDEALWDAMLEEEIQLVDTAILRSSPARQRKLWLYRNSLVKQLTALRHQPVPEKYLF
ncbi:MAG: hypothetical protein KUG71_04185 [Porticoccaceae bacterium]|nr:hypothetical protein [Porticoccaceae bacterium]